ncbi:Protocadherin Fat 4 [Schistosoma japonicum]|nr:Protocadherin Fat 4 [Schistosoma japonicum]
MILSSLREVHQLSYDINENNINKGENVQFRFRAIVEDEATRPYTRSSEATVIILVTDENDESPTISLLPNPELINANALNSVTGPNSFNFFSVFENQPINTVVATVQAYDPDFGGKDQVECNLKDSNFSLVRLTSQNQLDSDRNIAVNTLTEYHLITARVLDRESTSHQVATIVCSDMVGHYTERNVTIRIMDQNDNRPKFVHDTFYFQVDENSPLGTQVKQHSQKVVRDYFNDNYPIGPSHGLSATDLDIGINSQMTFFLYEDGINSTKFKIDSHTGIITTMDVFDRELKEKYTLTAIAIDHGNPSLTGTAKVQIIINDLNDNEPIFSKSNYTFHIQENQPRSTTVGQVSATDLDSSIYGPLEYGFANDQDSVNFTIDKITGIIRNRQSLDREEKAQYTFRVLVKDTKVKPSELNLNTQQSKSIQYTGTSTVTVIVDDVNDNWPVFVSPNATSNTLAISLGQKITGYKLAYIQAEDKDEGKNGLITYTILTGNNYGFFGLDPVSGLLYLSNPITNGDNDNSYNNVLYNMSNTSNLPSDDEFNNLLRKSSMHILTLEACDQGEDPKPRCTLYNNLKIIIQNNNDKDIHNLENTRSHYNSHIQLLNLPELPGLTSGSAISSLAYKQHQLNQVQNNLNSIQGTGDDNIHQKTTGFNYGNLLINKQIPKVISYTTNDIMITCLSIIFSLVLIATLILVCLVRRKVVWFKNQTKKRVNQIENEPTQQLGAPNHCSTSSIKSHHMTSFGHGKLLSSIHENSSSIHHNTELLSKSTISNKNNNNNHENNYDVNFVSIQNSLNNSFISPDECISPGSIYHLITSLSPTHATQTTPAIAMTTTTDYKQYGCNTQKLNHKLNHLNSTVKRNDHDAANVPMIFQKANEHNSSVNKFDDYQTLDYLGLVSPTVLNKQSVYHKNLGLVTYSSHVMNMPKLISLPSGGQITFNHQNTIRNENKELFTSVHRNPSLDNSPYHITHYHTQSQPQPMNNRYTTLPTYSDGNQTICDMNSTFTSTYNQHSNRVTTYNKSNNNGNNNTMLPYLVMTASNVNLNNLNYSNKNNKYPKQSHTYYDIRQPDLKVNTSVMYKSKSQQLSTATKYHIPFDDSIKDDYLMESSNVWKNEEQLPHTTGNINRSSNNNNDNNSVRGADISRLCYKTKIWTPDEPNTPLENWVALTEQNSQSRNNNTLTSSVSLTANSDNVIPTVDNAIINATYASNKGSSNTTSENQFSHMGRQQNLGDSGKYMSAALRESSFV